MEVGRCGNWNVLIANLKRQGVEVHFKHKGQTSEVQGVVFSMNGYHFNGSKVDRRFSYSKIDAALQHNRCRERMGITAGIYETATPSAPSGTAQSELFNGSWGLLKAVAHLITLLMRKPIRKWWIYFAEGRKLSAREVLGSNILY